MAKRQRRVEAVRLSGRARRSRRALMLTTALQAAALAVLSVPRAQAQPAPNARPTGGAVVVGAATISQTATNTTITQPATSPRSGINWQSFNVGSSQSVTFNQPSQTAIVLNRVVGPDPSQIAGKITANGQIALVNQSGVVFYKGSQVNAAGLMVSSNGITNENFRNGRMVFDQPGKPNARIENHGDITVKETGLAALVAPQVANSGKITAKLGTVVLASGTAQTVDLYGDKMLSIDVTGQVKQVPVGPDGKKATALVTNTGTILADGGNITLTAQAADGIVQNLVSAGGRLQADTVGGKTGTIKIAGIGGSITIEGDVAARGMAAGTKGGDVELTATQAVRVASTANVSAAGRAGGGAVAVGTTLARAKGGTTVTAARTAKTVTVEAGAQVSADATDSGNGGKVVALSTDRTTMAGTISARGGKTKGDGGFVEVSGGSPTGSGTGDTTAPAGAMGSLLLDPEGDMVISDTQPAALGGASWVSIASLGNTNVTETTAGSLYVSNSAQTANRIALSGTLSLTATGGSITIDRGMTISAAGVQLTAGGGITLGGASGAIFRINSAQAIAAGPAASITGTASVGLTAGGSIEEPSANITTAALTANAGGHAYLDSAGNLVSSLGAVTVSGGDFKFVSGTSFAVNGPVAVTQSGATASLSYVPAADTPATAAFSAITINGPITAGASLGGGLVDGHVVLATSASRAWGGNFADVTEPTGTIAAATLAGDVAGSLLLPGAGNLVSALGAVTVRGGDFTFVSGTPFAVTGPVAATQSGATVALGYAPPAGTAATASFSAIAINGSVTAGANLGGGLVDGHVVLTTGTLPAWGGNFADVTEPTGTIAAATLTGDVGGSLLLTGTGNQIAALGAPGTAVPGLAAHGASLSVVNATALTVAGTVASDGDATINAAAALTVGAGAAVTATGDATLTAGTALENDGAVSGRSVQLNGVSIVNTGTVSGTANTTLTASDYIINDTTGGISGGTGSTTALNATGNITQSGSVTGDTVTETAGGVIIHAGTSQATTQLTLEANGAASLYGVQQSAGSVIGSGGALTIDSATGMALGGLVSSPSTVRLVAANGDIRQNAVLPVELVEGDITSPVAPSALAAAPTGAIHAGVLTGSATGEAIFDRVADATDANLVSALGAFSTGTGFTLENGAAMQVTGAVTAANSGATIRLAYTPQPGAAAPTASFVAININGGSLTAGAVPGESPPGTAPDGHVVLVTNRRAGTTDNFADVGETAGSIAAGTLTASIDGSMRLNTAGNLIGALGQAGATPAGITVNGSEFDLTDGAPIVVAQAITAPAATVQLTYQRSALLDAPPASFDAISLNGGSITANQVALATLYTGTTHFADVSEPNGAIVTNLLSGSVQGSAALTNAGNQIAAVGAFSATADAPRTAGGDIDLVNGIGLSVTGALSADHDATIAPAGDLTVTSAGSVRAGNVATLSGADIANAGSITGTVATTLTATTDITNTGSITDGVPATRGTLTLVATRGDIHQDGGIDAGVVSETAGNDIDHAGGTTHASAQLTLTAKGTASAIDFVEHPSATISSDGNLTIVAATGMALAGGVSAPAGTVQLTASGGDIGQTDPGASAPTGSLAANLLTGSATGQALFDRVADASGGNAVSRLGAFTTGGNFTLEDGVPLTVGGTVAADGPGATITLGYAPLQILPAPTIRFTAIDIADGGTLRAGAYTEETPGVTPDGHVVLTTANAGGLADAGETGGRILAGGLAANVDGALVLASPGNLIGAIDGIGVTVAGDAFTLTDGASLVVRQPVVAPGATVTLTYNGAEWGDSAPGASFAAISIDGGSITTGSTLRFVTSDPSGTAFDDVTEPNGSVTAGLLTGAVSGSLALGSATNQIGAVGPLSAGNALTLNDAASLTVQNTVSAGQDAQLTTAGSLTAIAGASLTAGHDVTLSANGADTAYPLRIAAGATVTASTGSAGLVSARGIAIGGTVLASSGTATLVAKAGDITETDVGASAPTGVVGAAGLLGAATAGFGAAGQASFTTPLAAAPGNQIGQLGTFTTSGGFTLYDQSPLFVTGVVQTGPGQRLWLQTPALTMAEGALIAPADLSTPGVVKPGLITLQADAMSLAGGSVSALDGMVALAPLTGGLALSIDPATAGGHLSLTPADLAAIATIGGGPAPLGTQTLALGSLDGTAGTIAAGNVQFNTVADVRGAANTLDVLTTGSVTEAANGGIAVNVLTGAAPTGSIVLSNGVNIVSQIGTTGSVGGLSNPAAAAVANLTAAGDVTVADQTSLLAATIVQAGGNAVLGVSSGNTLTVGGLVSGPTVTLSAGNVKTPGSNGTIVIAGNVIGGTVGLYSAGDTTETGTITASVLTGQAGVISDESGAGGTLGSAILTGANQVPTLGNYFATGDLTFNDQQALTVNGLVAGALASTATPGAAGPYTVALNVPGNALTIAGRLEAGVPVIDPPTLAGGNVTLDAGSIAIPGSIVAQPGAAGGGVLTLRSGTSIVETVMGAISASVLTGSAGNTGPGDTILEGNNGIASIRDFLSRQGLLTLLDGASLSVGGTVSATGGATLVTNGAMTQTDGSIIGSSVTLAAGGSVSQAGGAAIGATAAGGTVSLDAGQDIAVGGTVAANGVVTLAADGAVTQTSGSIAGSSVTATAGGSVSQASGAAIGAGGTVSLDAGQDIAVGGMVSANGVVTLAAGGAVTQTSGAIAGSSVTATAGGPVSQAGGAAINATAVGGTVSLDAGQDIALGGSVTASDGGAVALVARNGAIMEREGGAQGVIAAPFLTASAGGSVTLDNGANRVGTVQSLIAQGGPLIFSNASDLTVAGPVTAATAATINEAGFLTLAGGSGVTAPQVTLNANAMALGGVVTGRAGGAGRVALNATGGDITETGLINADTLSVQTPGNATLYNTANRIGALSGVTAGRSFSLADAQSLMIGGLLSSPIIHINLGGNAAVLQNGLSIRTSGVPRPQGKVAGLSALPTYASFLPGLYIEAGSVVQSGVATVSSLGGASPTIRLDVTAPGGRVTFGGLSAPTSDLILDLGTGVATGVVTLGNLDVAYTRGSAGSAELTGSVAGITGQSTAGRSFIYPASDSVYRINGCAIASVNCFVLSVASVPVVNPLQDIYLGVFGNPQDDGDLLQPDVAEQDYYLRVLGNPQAGSGALMPDVSARDY